MILKMSIEDDDKVKEKQFFPMLFSLQPNLFAFNFGVVLARRTPRITFLVHWLGAVCA